MTLTRIKNRRRKHNYSFSCSIRNQNLPSQTTLQRDLLSKIPQMQLLSISLRLRVLIKLSSENISAKMIKKCWMFFILTASA